MKPSLASPASRLLDRGLLRQPAAIVAGLKMPRLVLESIKTRRGSVVDFQRCLMCTRIGKSLKGDSAPSGLGGLEDGAELLGTTQIAVGNSKVLGVSGAPRARS
jgi:hypothetical protein